ncbi:lasso peptide biosynthesis B2 protein [Paenibacillus sp. Marseille-Q4541]|uniref:lasso peptide biosynthesis B2 protein n=1 Tax=Paenibacillus sp. Marseille-Q4541 TaxID=2831522 RepID=UPI001BA8F70D|nr:lasso peptide biosynthesis B2 protein [Paenibacillus sp. Marseille-Q4541]
MRTVLFRSFLKQKWAVKRMIVEAILFLGYARVMNFLPFARIAPLLGTEQQETTYERHPVKERTALHISKVIYMVSKHTPWKSECMVSGIAAMKMLKRRNIESTLYFGIAKNEHQQLIAHAWLRCGTLYVTGAEGIENFTVVNKFAKQSKHVNRGCVIKHEG